MKKSLCAALLATALITISIMRADEAPCCAGMTEGSAKTSCAAILSTLELTPAQKAKMEKLAAECDQTGCTKESEAKFYHGAKAVLTKKQFAAWKAAEKSQG